MNKEGFTKVPVGLRLSDGRTEYKHRRFKDVLAFLHDRYGDKYLKLELGPGRKQSLLTHPSIGLNPSADPVADIFWDLNNGIPLPGDCIDEIYSNQTLEHIKRENFIFLMNEMWSVMKVGGVMEHCVPEYTSSAAVGDPTHYNMFSRDSFRYFCIRNDGTMFTDRFSDYGITCRFMMESQEVRPGLDITVRMVKLK